MSHRLNSSPPVWQTAGAFIGSGLLYIGLLYFTPRPAFFQLTGLYLLLFAFYIWVVKSIDSQQFIISAAVVFRLIALFALPVLSDDYFRFIWDGRLLSHGVNPFSQLPSAYMEDPASALSLGLNSELFNGLNSPEYFTIYPPVLQGIFFTAASLFPNSMIESVWVMKIFVFLAEIGSIFFIGKLLKHFHLPEHFLAIYALNPLVIIELTGNLHFEAMMIFFLLWSVWLFVKEKWLWSTIPFALAVGSKLLPVMLLPLLLRRLGWWRTMIYGGMVFIFTAVLFIPIFDLETFKNLFSSIELYFQKFEFNASLYYLVRWAGFQVTGYNIIQTAGKILALLTMIGIFVYALMEQKPDWKNLPGSMMWVFLFYFALASIVHPWYTIPMLALSVFTRFRWPMIWTLLIPLSYFTYRTTAYTENLWLVGLEYIILTIWIIWELRKEKRIINLFVRPEHKAT